MTYVDISKLWFNIKHNLVILLKYDWNSLDIRYGCKWKSRQILEARPEGRRTRERPRKTDMDRIEDIVRKNGAGITESRVGLDGLGVTCSPRDPRSAGPNPAEVYESWAQVLRRDLELGPRVWDFRLVKEPQAWKNRTLSKINRHIHVLISKFEGAQ